MKISVIIPAYNCAATIGAALGSVFAQTLPPDEIIVVNDGSTDKTASILDSYLPRIRVLSQTNGGVSRARNRGCQIAQGDLLAFLDSDDLWHPRYLEYQASQYKNYPEAVAYFTGHINFQGSEIYHWGDNAWPREFRTAVIDSVNFLQSYNASPGLFACISHCCVPKRALMALGSNPFCETLPMAEDLHLFNRLGLLGEVVYSPAPYTAYRVSTGSLSSDRRRVTEAEVHAFELLQSIYATVDSRALRAAFAQSFAMKRRLWAKMLLETGEVKRARRQLIQSVRESANPRSIFKSIALLVFSYLPDRLRPTLANRGRTCELPNGAARAL
jgi:GT2 family glycosyltransferase